MMHAVILAGGKGSRLWPISSKQTPKPFLQVGNESLIQKAFIRASKLSSVHNIITITNSDYLLDVKKSYSQIHESCSDKYSQEIILESSARDTAAAITAAAVHIFINHGPNEPIIILPSDHIITDSIAFSSAVNQARDLALNGKIVTLGIEPNYPQINYGYIEYKGNEVIRFVEKPSLDTAINYFNSKKFLWNSGILCFTAKTFLEEMKIFCPELLALVKQAINRSFSSGLNSKETFLNKYIWDMLPKISIDYALLEKSKRIAVIPCNIGWNDVGNWYSMSKMGSKDENGNSITGNVTLHGSANCYVEGKSNKTIAVIGVSNLAIIETDTGFLVIDKNNPTIPKDLFTGLQEKSIL